MKQELALAAQKINQEFALKRESGNRDAELQARIAKVKNPQIDEEGNVASDKDPTLDGGAIRCDCGRAQVTQESNREEAPKGREHGGSSEL